MLLHDQRPAVPVVQKGNLRITKSGTILKAKEDKEVHCKKKTKNKNKLQKSFVKLLINYYYQKLHLPHCDDNKGEFE